MIAYVKFELSLHGLRNIKTREDVERIRGRIREELWSALFPGVIGGYESDLEIEFVEHAGTFEGEAEGR